VGARATAILRLAARTVTSPAALRAQLGSIRREGLAVTEDELETGFVAVAAPVFDHQGAVVAAVSVGGPGNRLREKTLTYAIERTLAAARRISHELGAR
jgi:DNA-binding IclR family transcriptional regulator